MFKSKLGSSETSLCFVFVYYSKIVPPPGVPLRHVVFVVCFVFRRKSIAQTHRVIFSLYHKVSQFITVILSVVLLCFCVAIILLSVSSFTSPLDSHKNMSSSLITCLTILMMYWPYITLLFHFFFKDSSNLFVFVVCIYFLCHSSHLLV